MKYYHVTSFEGWREIPRVGLRADVEGYIYLLDDQSVAGYVASHQLGRMDYGVIEIDPAGILVDIEPDNVAELTASHQFRIKQDLIEPKYVKSQSNMYRLA